MPAITELVPKGGFLARWLQYCEPFEFSDAFALYSLLAVTSAAIDRRILINPGTEPSPYTNVFAILYGPSGSRKGTALRRALKLLGTALPDVPILPRSFTFERLMSRLAEESSNEGQCGGLIISDEFQRLVGGRDYQQENLGFLTELWDCPPTFTRDTHAHEFEELVNPYVTVLWCLTPEGVKKIDASVLDSGGIRRMLIIPSYRPKRINARPGHDATLFQALSNVFAERLGTQAFQDVHMVLSDEAQERMDQWYYTFIATKLETCGEREGYFVSCAQAHALKIGALVQVLEGGAPTTMELFALNTGINLIEDLMPSMFQVYAGLVNTEFAKQRASILRTVQAAGGDIVIRDLLRGLTNTLGVPQHKVMASIQSLVDDEALKVTGNGTKVELTHGHDRSPRALGASRESTQGALDVRETPNPVAVKDSGQAAGADRDAGGETFYERVHTERASPIVDGTQYVAATDNSDDASAEPGSDGDN